MKSLFLSLVLLSSLSCGLKKNRPPIIAARLIVNYPILYPDARVEYQPDTISIYNFKSVVAFSVEHFRQFFDRGQMISEQKVYNYFVYREGKQFGVFLDSASQPFDSLPLLKVDSMLFARAYQTDFSTILDSSTLVRSQTTNGRLTESYRFHNNFGPQAFDSIYLFYDKSLNKIPYSLDRSVDSLKHTKLYKATILWNEFGVKGSDGYYPRRTLDYEIIESSVPVPSVVEKMLVVADRSSRLQK